MFQRVLLVAWKGASATAWVGPMQDGGYAVLLEDTTGERAWRTAKERGIDCVVIDGQKKPTHGRATGNNLRDTAKTREIPIIWTNLDPEDEAGVRQDVKPDRVLVAPTSIESLLSTLEELAAERGLAATVADVESPPAPSPSPGPSPESAPIADPEPAPSEEGSEAAATVQQRKLEPDSGGRSRPKPRTPSKAGKKSKTAQATGTRKTSATASSKKKLGGSRAKPAKAAKSTTGGRSRSTSSGAGSVRAKSKRTTARR